MFIAIYTDLYSNSYTTNGDSIEECVANMNVVTNGEYDFDYMQFFAAIAIQVSREITYKVI